MNTRETAEKYGVDPERLYDRYKKGDTLDTIQTRLRTTGQVEPIEPKRCVNCRQHKSPGCCDVFDVSRMLDLGLIDFGPPAETYADDHERPERPISATFAEDLLNYESPPDDMVDPIKYAIGVDLAKGDSITVMGPVKLEPCHCGNKSPELEFGALSCTWFVSCFKCDEGCNEDDPSGKNQVAAAEAWNLARIQERVEEYYPTPKVSESPRYETSLDSEWSEVELNEFLGDLGVAKGAILDRLGKIVNWYRHGRTDAVFRKKIRSDAIRLCRHKASPGSGVGFTWA